jgi:hypothetical protein
MGETMKKPGVDEADLQPGTSEYRVWVRVNCWTCGGAFGFWRWKRPRPEPRVCASCARDRWLIESQQKRSGQ